jgi:hypothetical protein
MISLQPKRTKPVKNVKEMSFSELMVVVSGVIVIVLVYGIGARQEIHKAATKIAVPIIGEWRAEDKPWQLTFNADKTVLSATSASPERKNSELSAAEASLSGPGTYFLDSTGSVKIKMQNGRTYSTQLKEASPTRFDLIDGETDGVTTFDKAP